MAGVIWPQILVDLVLKMPDREREPIFHSIAHLEDFPEMFPIRTTGRFRGYRCLATGSWLVYYRFVGGKVFLRAIWPAGIV